MLTPTVGRTVIELHPPMTHEIRNRKTILFIKHNPNFCFINNMEEQSYFDLSPI